MLNNGKISNILKTFMFLMLALMVTGCADFKLGGAKKNSAVAPPAKVRKTTAVYYDFKDVLVPRELTVVEDATVVVSTPGYTSGLLTLKGRVKKQSLYNFFSNNMLKDNWNIVSQIKSPSSTIMIFQKAARWAVITIRAKDFYTYVEVGVAPTLDKAGIPAESELFN